MASPLFDITEPTPCPPHTQWCTSCGTYEEDHRGGSYVPESQAPVSYDLWLRITDKYDGDRFSYTEWINDGQPEV